MLGESVPAEVARAVCEVLYCRGAIPLWAGIPPASPRQGFGEASRTSEPVHAGDSEFRRLNTEATNIGKRKPSTADDW